MQFELFDVRFILTYVVIEQVLNIWPYIHVIPCMHVNWIIMMNGCPFFLELDKKNTLNDRNVDNTSYSFQIDILLSNLGVLWAINQKITSL